MTEDERRNRNPAVEVHRFVPADHPEIRVDELELAHVYVLQGQRSIATFNYAGKVHALHPRTLDVMVCHQFVAPRVPGLEVNLVERGGCLYSGDAADEKITLRRFTGPDA